MKYDPHVNPKMISDKGQYFTPRQVVRAAVEMLQIDENMRIVDPACGSGGFLIYSMERVWKKLEKEWASDIDALAGIFCSELPLYFCIFVVSIFLPCFGV